MRKLFTFGLFALLLTAADPALAAGAKEIESQTELQSLQGAVTVIYKLLIVFLPGVATVYLILSGYRYIIAQGNQELTEKAKKSLTYAVFGIIIAFASVAIINLIAGQLGYRV